MIGAVIISHGKISDAVLDALYLIAGEQEKIVAVSNMGRDLKQLEDDLHSARKKLEGCKEIIFFADLQGGSCSIICRKLLRQYKNYALITGYNLPMLIEFTFYRERPLEEVLRILETKGKREINIYSYSDD
jgi:PTS system mannose-specific IIA component/PTS system mannose-specific IIB component